MAEKNEGVMMLFESMPPELVSFVFVLAVMYGSLEASGLFKKDDKGSKSVNVLVSLVIAFFGAQYPPLTSFLSVWVPQLTVLIIGLFFLAFVSKLLLSIKGEKQNTDWGLLVVIGVLVLLVLETTGGEWLWRFGFDPDMIMMITAFGIFGIILFAVGKSGIFQGN